MRVRARWIPVAALAAACVSPFDPVVVPRDVGGGDSPRADATSGDVVEVRDVTVSDVPGADAFDAALPDAFDAALPDVTDAALPDVTDAARVDAADVVGVDAADVVGVDAADVVGVDAADVARPDAFDADAADACPTGTTFCAGACRNLATDPANCGTCGNVCNGRLVCISSVCRCPVGTTNCGNECVVLETSGRNCGGCGRTCATPCGGATCEDPCSEASCAGEADGGVADVVEIAAGGRMTCARLAGGQVRCAILGSLGFVPVPGVTDAVQIAVGDRFACYRNSVGAVYCWGTHAVGLGDGVHTSSATPVLVNAGTVQPAVWVAASAFRDTACIAFSDGTARCWGDGAAGAIGDGQRMNRAQPVPVMGLAGANAVVLGRGHACARVFSGQVWCWGSNDFGQLGNNSLAAQLTPVRTVMGSYPQLETAAQIAAGENHTCALLGGGDAYCWGRNNRGNLGIGGTTDVPTPYAVPLGQTVRSISGAGAHTCAWSVDGRVRCWGDGSTGAMGNGATTETNSSYVLVPNLNDAAEVTAGVGYTCTRSTSGRVQCWGDNQEGQLGEGSQSPHLTPTPVRWP